MSVGAPCGAPQPIGKELLGAWQMDIAHGRRCAALKLSLRAFRPKPKGPLLRQARLAALLKRPEQVRALQEGVRRHQVPAFPMQWWAPECGC
jgi:hypothetical protein